MTVSRVVPLVLLAAAFSPGSGARPAVQDGHLLVTFAAPAAPLNRRAGSGFKGYDGTAYAATATARYLTRQLADEYALQAVDDWPMDALDVHCVLYRVSRPAQVDRIIAALDRDPRVDSVQRLQRFRVQGAASPRRYNDPYHSLQRGWREASLARAHRFSTGRNVRVGIVDTAVDGGHPDLKAAVAGAERFAPGSGAPAGDFHGTAVAGIIAAEADNGLGIVGVAPDARLFSLQACWAGEDGAQAECDSFTLAKALNWAVRERLEVVNLSLAGPEDPLLERLIRAALEQGTAVVAADGSRDGLRFPASVAGVIAVREAGRADVPAGGETGIFYAPGRDVMTTVPQHSYDFVSGSSMAAAHVSGLVALLRAYNPALAVNRIPALLVQTAVPGRGEPVRAVHDACALLAAASPPAGAPPDCTPPALVKIRG